MKSLLLLHCYLFLIGNSLADNGGNCQIKGIDDTDYQTTLILHINDTQIETNIFEGTFTGNLVVKSCSHKYFEGTTEDDKFVIKTTAAFSNIDEDTPKQDNTFVLINIECSLTCTGDSTLQIQFVVTDINTHPPKFGKETYVYNVATPVMPLTDFTIYGETITASDIDFSNQDITFTVTPDDFSITTTIEKDKTYSAVFAAKHVIQLTETRQYTIKATDSGTIPKPLSTEATLTLSIDESTSLDAPSFEHTSYSFNYTVNGSSPALIPLSGTIKIVTNKASFLTDPTLAGEYSDHFDVTLKEETVEVSAKELLPTDIGSFIILTLSVTTDNIASTSIIVYLPEQIDKTPQFSRHFYTGTYNDTNDIVKLDDPIKIDSVSTPEVSLSGEYSQHFNIKYDKATATCLITVKSNLSAAEIKSESYISLTVKAAVGESYDTAAVILSLSEHVLQFTAVLYTATYKDDNTVTIDKGFIGFTTKANNVSIDISGTCKEYFGTAYNSAKDQWSLSVTKALSDDILKTEKEIMLTLTATDDYKDQAESVVTIQLPVVNADPPTFSDVYYFASYTTNSTMSTVTLDKDITITNKGDQSNIKISIDSYSDYFGITYDKTVKKWVLKLLSPLTDDILLSKKEIVLILTAEEENNSNKGQAVVVVNWIIPTFSEPYYVGVYPTNKSGTIEIKPAISFTNVDDIKNVVITLDSYTDNFDLTYISNKWTLTIKKELDKSVIDNTRELVLTLTAKETDSKSEGQSVLLIQLPTPEEAPQFSEIYYLGQYPEIGKGNIDLDSAISFTNIKDPSNIVITLDSYQDNFIFTYNSSKWTLTIAKSLDKTILTKSKELHIVLTATESDNKHEGQSVLILELPVKQSPRFSEAYYLAEYPKNGSSTIDLENPITFVNTDDPSSIKISLDNYTSNFEFKYDKDKWYINIKSKLSETILKNNDEILMTMTAEIENKNEALATLILKLPAHETVPIFSEAYYVADYLEGGKGSVKLQEPIAFLNVKDPSTISIDLDNYAENFEITYDSVWNIQIKKKLEQSVLRKNAELIIKMIATNSEVDGKGESVLVLRLPTADSIFAPEFLNAYYTANYTDNKTGAIEFDNPIKFTNIDDLTTVTISLDNFADNFEIDYESDRWYINVKKSLENSVLSKNTDLLMTLTASQADNKYKGEAALMIRLPSTDSAAPKFSKAFYSADYPKSGTGNIQFESPIEFTNVNDPTTLSLSLDNYLDNFKIRYGENGWYINISKSLEDTILNSNMELVMTITATVLETKLEGESALVLKLPAANNAIAPQFAKAYYIAEYPKNSTTVIEFENPIKFTNVVDLTKVTLSLDNYADNFEIVYDSNRWYINVKKSLEKSVLNSNVELVMSLIATEDGNENKGYSALVLNLPAAINGTAPKFTETYYIAKYPENGTGTIEFDKSISFSNVDDPSKLAIHLDNFANNFDVVYDSNRWHINIKKNLSESVLHNNVELVMSLIATEDENDDEGTAALILKLPTADSGTAPKFLDAYYIAQYPENGKGIIEFENAIQFTNVDEPTNVSITLETYKSNFEILYHSTGWYINIKEKLDNTVLHTNVELVMTLIATKSGSNDAGKSALVLNLPTATIGTAPQFSEAYYISKYPKSGSGVIEFENPIEFTNVDDITKIEITIDNYADNFEIKYDSGRWYINIKQSLDEAILHKNIELVFALIATETENNEKGRSAVVLELPSTSNETTLEFSEVYYIAQYPINGSGVIEFETPIKFKNIDDPTLVKISLNNYSSYLEIAYDHNRWYINIIKSLDESIINKNPELVVTLSASETNGDRKGYSALILKIPSATEPPKFSAAYYIAEYPEEGSGIIEFENPIEFSNVAKPTDVKISLDSYFDNFEIIYSSDRWYINIKQSLEDSTLNKNVELVMTMTATEEGHVTEGEAALVLKLPVTAVGPEFSEAYYIADYPEKGTGTIEFESPLAFLNAKDPTTISITLGNYSKNFEVKYASNRWYINITKSLDAAILKDNVELVMTLTATETDNTKKGYSALVLKLPLTEEVTAPEFSKAYYLVDYPEDGKATIELPIDFLNVDDPQTLTITLDNYVENFAITYDSDKWKMNIKSSLNDSVLNKNTELVMTLVATETGNKNSGYSALVLKLPTASNGTAIKFSEAYYTADYPESGKGTVEFGTPIEFKNVDNPKFVTIKLDNYADNFEITYVSNKWVLNIKTSLDTDTLNKNSELVMTLIATNSDDNTQDRSALILNLPVTSTTMAPQFSEAYYLADYPEDGKGSINLNIPIAFSNVEDPQKITITLDNYTDNFDVTYDSKKWNINIKSSLEDSVLHKNTELLMTLVATETDNKNLGYSALVLNLPTALNGTAIRFSKTYYTAKYPESGSGTIEIDPAIEFLNVDDQKSVTINLDTYGDNFEFTYVSNKWLLNVKNGLDSDILDKNSELVMTLVATSNADNTVGSSALILKMPTTVAETGPVFTEAYYTATYSEDADSIEFEKAISFENVDDPKKITIKLDNFSDYFDIKLDSNKWYIQVKKVLDDSILKENAELVATLIATEGDIKAEGQSAFVLKLPSISPKVAPEFSETLYTAVYKIEDGKSSIVFTDEINITNKADLSQISITIDNYTDYFKIDYVGDKKIWVVNVIKQISDSILINKSDLAIAITATDTSNNLTGHSVIDLNLPTIKSDSAPKFSKTYYVAKYTISGELPSVTLDTPISIANRDDLTSISITIDNYTDNFDITFVDETDEWKVNVKKNLDELVLNSKVDLVMMLTATDKTNNEIGQCALLLTLPVVNNKEAPKFSSIYYFGEYETSNSGTINLETAIEIVNKDDLTKVKISFDDNYKDNFGINYDTDKKKWILNVKSPLDSSTLKDKNELILILTATETNNDNIGQAALVLELPEEEIKLPPKFSHPHYTAEYLVDDKQATVAVTDSITIVNKEDLTDISVTLDSYDTNFNVIYDSSNTKWNLTVKEPLSKEILESTSEIVLTLAAKEEGNDNTGDSTLILALPLSHDNSTKEIVTFSQVHYSSNYSVEDDKPVIEMDDTIIVKSDVDIKKLEVSFEKEDYVQYFNISEDSKDTHKYIVSVKTLPSTILDTYVSLPLTLVASVGDSKAYATLVVNLPTAATRAAIRFSESLYNATYKVVNGTASFEVQKTIEIQTEENDDKIVSKISSGTGYEEYFGWSYSNKILTVKKEKDIPEDKLKGISFIPLILTVGVNGTTDTTSAALIVKIDFSDDEKTTEIRFSDALYSAKYEVTDGVGKLTVNDAITIKTDESYGNIEVTVANEYSKYFTINYSNKVVTVTLNNQLSTEILNSSCFLPVILQASVRDTSYQALAVLNIKIVYDGKEDNSTIEFSTILYTAEYSVTDGKGELKLNEAIQVITDAADDKIVPSISDGSIYDKYFEASYTAKSVSVKLSEDLPESALKLNLIALTLTVTITGTTHTSSAVLNVNINVPDNEDNRSVAFGKVLYDGKYDATNGDAVFTTDEITIVTNETDGNIEVIISNEYASYFTVLHLNKIVTLELTGQLPSEVINVTSFIPVILQVSITGTSYQESAVLIIKIIYDDSVDSGLIQFSSILYNADYIVTDGEGKLEVNDVINIITDSPDNEILASISEEYSNYFSLAYSSKVVTIKLKEQLSSSILNATSFIPVILKASINGTIYKASAVLIVAIQTDDKVDTGLIDFSSTLYGAKYSVTDGKATLDLKEAIKVITNRPNTEVTANISKDSGYSDYFKVSYSSNTLSIQVEKLLPQEVLDDNCFIPLTLIVGIKDTALESSAVLNIEFSDSEDSRDISFSTILYNGKYKLDNGSGVLTIDSKIEVVTEEPDASVSVKLSDDAAYNKYFTASYANHTVSILLADELPQGVLKDNTFIALTLTVEITGTTHTASAVLNIEIDYDRGGDNDGDNKHCEVSHTKTVYITVISILSVLLIALIAAAVAFYLLRIRQRNYANLEEESGKVRFNKNAGGRTSSDLKTSSALEERRPTAFNFTPMPDDIDDSVSDPEKIRRKSVAFDDNVEKLQIEPSIDEDNISEDISTDNPTNKPEDATEI